VTFLPTGVRLILSTIRTAAGGYQTQREYLLQSPPVGLGFDPKTP
jgi:hypothetical protein